MKQNKFLVKIPLNENDSTAAEYKTYTFNSVDDVAGFLEVTKNTIYSMRTKRLKMKHSNKTHLQGIIIEKLPVYYNAKKNEEEMNKAKAEYKNKLLQKKGVK